MYWIKVKESYNLRRRENYVQIRKKKKKEKQRPKQKNKMGRGGSQIRNIPTPIHKSI